MELVCEIMYLEEPLKIADFLSFRYPDSLFYYNKTINKELSLCCSDLFGMRNSEIEILEVISLLLLIW